MPAAEQASFQSTLLTVLSELKTILSAVEEKQADALAEDLKYNIRVRLCHKQCGTSLTYGKQKEKQT